MTSKLLYIAIAVLFTCGLMPAAEDETMERGRHFTDLFYTGQFDELWESMSPELQGVFGGVAQMGAMRHMLTEQLGSEAEVIEEKVRPEGGMTTYIRKAKFEKLDQPLFVLWTFDDQGIATGFQVSPNAGEAPTEAPTDYLEYQTKTELQLPFAKGDEWFVFWGGRTVDINYHTAYPDQRFAYDILAMVDGSTHKGDGKSLEDYYCFDRVIVAPGAGRVISVENGLADNSPGVMDPANALGNHVIIDHGNGEYSFMAHFKKGSVLPKQGQEVKAGEPIARTGNSGNTSEPHLHYHLQNTPTFGTGGKGLPAQFRRYVSNGSPIERGEPIKGERIQSGE